MFALPFHRPNEAGDLWISAAKTNVSAASIDMSGIIHSFRREPQARGGPRGAGDTKILGFFNTIKKQRRG
jgi:hypothetical protein